jgi:hypothetical protein
VPVTRSCKSQEGHQYYIFICNDQVPKGHTVTYGRIVCKLCPQKNKVHRTRLTVCGNLIDYHGDVSAKTAGLTMAKLLFNSVLSTPNARFAGIDVKLFYLNTLMDRYEYMLLLIDLIPQEIINQYNLLLLVYNGFVYMEICQGMYRLPQAGMLTNKLLQKRLARHGYRPTEHTHGLWRHDTRPILFSLVVENFGVDEDKLNMDEVGANTTKHRKKRNRRQGSRLSASVSGDARG